MANVILTGQDKPLMVRNTAQEIDALIGSATGGAILFVVVQVDFVPGTIRNERINLAHIIKYYPTVDESKAEYTNG